MIITRWYKYFYIVTAAMFYLFAFVFQLSMVHNLTSELHPVFGPFCSVIIESAR